MISIRPVEGLPEIAEGERLGELLAHAADPRAGEVVVVSHKVVAKAEGRTVELGSVKPGRRAIALANTTGKDPRLVELILRESTHILRATRTGVVIAQTRGGLVCANAGIDSSNVPGEETVVLLPVDPDGSARRIRAEIEAVAAARPAVLVADSLGRAWRLGQADAAIGLAGLPPLDDWRGATDRQGQELAATRIALADQVAAAAALGRDKDAGLPAAVISGLERHITAEDGPGAAALQRPPTEDLFR